MNERLNWMLPSIFVGRMFSTDVRVNASFAIVPLIVCPKYGMILGLTFTVLLYFSVLLHEFAHVFAARWTGGFADEIHLTPIGGIAIVRPGQGAYGMAVTAAAGPAVNLFLCLLTFPGWYARETLWSSLNPLVLPIDRLNPADLWHDLGLLLFIVNWIGLLVNLLPVVPLDGGQFLRAVLSTQIHPELVNRTACRAGLLVAVLFLMFGAIFDLSQIVLIGTFLLAMNLIQLHQEETGEALDDSSFGADFSSGYSSLEQANPVTTRDVKLGPIQRWRERRRIRREQEDRIRRTEAEQQLDSLLAKVHEQGLQSLSEQEKKLLQSCSEQLQKRGKSEN